ncbi:hypothetical protein L1987_17412 [Smallanthus sonchifolius]|uniref:Uncharacterized protein n=1 Tax=Smallanthus sonchifolius TaxID=185202 RepID=A0ACB9IXF3_9ASTR|nr:hypothetical protein L1987_17412 [Smallanthus sonchifolius]
MISKSKVRCKDFCSLCSNLRRTLLFDGLDVCELPYSADEGGGDEYIWTDVEVDIGSGTLPMSCMWEVMRRLLPPSLLSAAKLSFDDLDVRELPNSDDDGGDDEYILTVMEVDIGSGTLLMS